MKKLIITLLAMLPLSVLAQNNVWEVPDDPTQQKEQAQIEKQKKAREKEEKQQEDPKYLEGAVPLVDGRVVFTLDEEVPGMSAEDIYNKVYNVFREIVTETAADDLKPGSRIAAVNKAEHTVAANIREWLVFSSNFLQLDRTQMNYVLIAEATDHHLHLTMERINYAYEVGRDGREGLRVKAEEWTTDKMSLNKKKTKLNRMTAKFRKKTIDRKDNIFSRINKALGINN